MSAGPPLPLAVAAAKWLLIGCGGSGKSTLARCMAQCTGLPLIHLDALYWSPGWLPTPQPQWSARVTELLEQPAWIMDGNYGNTLALRLAACDAVVFLDIAPWRCLWRVVLRRLRFHGRGRPDMGPGCNERLDWAFVRFVLGYRHTRRPGVVQQLSLASSQGKVVYRLCDARQVERFMRDLPALVSPRRQTPGG